MLANYCVYHNKFCCSLLQKIIFVRCKYIQRIQWVKTHYYCYYFYRALCSLFSPFFFIACKSSCTFSHVIFFCGCCCIFLFSIKWFFRCAVDWLLGRKPLFGWWSSLIQVLTGVMGFLRLSKRHKRIFKSKKVPKWNGF